MPAALIKRVFGIYFRQFMRNRTEKLSINLLSSWRNLHIYRGVNSSLVILRGAQTHLAINHFGLETFHLSGTGLLKRSAVFGLTWKWKKYVVKRKNIQKLHTTTTKWCLKSWIFNTGTKNTTKHHVILTVYLHRRMHQIHVRSSTYMASCRSQRIFFNQQCKVREHVSIWSHNYSSLV